MKTLLFALTSSTLLFLLMRALLEKSFRAPWREWSKPLLGFAIIYPLLGMTLVIPGVVELFVVEINSWFFLLVTALTSGLCTIADVASGDIKPPPTKPVDPISPWPELGTSAWILPKKIRIICRVYALTGGLIFLVHAFSLALG